MATDLHRRHLHGLMAYTLAHEPQIHYAQVRPMRTVHLTEAEFHLLLANGGTVSMDCSEGVTCLCKWAGLRDPNGHHYDGSGYTGTLLARLPHYTDASKAKVGALCVFGPGSGDHVAMVMQTDPSEPHNPWMWSHGYEGGPRKVRFSVERAIHRRPATFLSIANL